MEALSRDLLATAGSETGDALTCQAFLAITAATTGRTGWTVTALWNCDKSSRSHRPAYNCPRDRPVVGILHLRRWHHPCKKPSDLDNPRFVGNDRLPNHREHSPKLCEFGCDKASKYTVVPIRANNVGIAAVWSSFRGYPSAFLPTKPLWKHLKSPMQSLCFSHAAPISPERHLVVTQRPLAQSEVNGTVAVPKLGRQG